MADMTSSNTVVAAPGEFIREELEARGWSQRDLAYVVGIGEVALAKIVSGRHGITADMAKKLAAAFDVSPELFVNLQAAFDLARAPAPDPAVARKGKLQSEYPVREMIRRGWLIGGDSIDLLEEQMARFLETVAGGAGPTAFAAKRTRYEDDVTPAQRVWVHRVRQLGREMTGERYSEIKLRGTIGKLRTLLVAPEGVRQVARDLSECGVRFVVVEGLHSEKIDGVCTWLNETAPVVGLSLRRDRIDNFWFVLRHELEHVLRGDGRDVIRVDAALSDDGAVSGRELPPSEVAANRAAADFCVPAAELDLFIARKAPYVSESALVGFASRIGVHPGVVAGQVRNRLGRWNIFARHLVKIREQVAMTAVVDGWGTVAPASW